MTDKEIDTRTDVTVEAGYWRSSRDAGFFVGRVEIFGPPELPVVIAQMKTARTPTMALALALEAAGQALKDNERARRRREGA